MNSNVLKEYIECIYKLESELFQQELLYYLIYSEIDEKKSFSPTPLNKKDSVSKNVLEAIFHGETLEDYFYSLFGCIFFGGIILFIISFILAIFEVGPFKQEPWKIISYTTFIGAIVCGVLWVGSGIIYGILEWKNTSEYNDQIEIDNNLITQQNKVNKDLSEKQAYILSKELSKIKALSNSTSETLNKFYDLNIIYPKYRNFVAISSFYEYFKSGRCNMLKGHGGAYDTFEIEAQQKMIIAKLDEVVESLNRIESSQYMLYSAINRSSQIATQMSNQIFNMSRNLKEISNNSLISTYYQKETALNTEVLRKIETFRLLHEKY